MPFSPVNLAACSSPHGYESVTSEPSLSFLRDSETITGLSETSTWELVKFRHLVDAVSFSDDFIVLKQIWCLHSVGFMNLFLTEGEQTFVSWHQHYTMNVINSGLSWYNRAGDHRGRGLEYLRNSYQDSLAHLPSEQNLASLYIDR